MADWNPALYSRFEDERTRPARELLARVALEAPRLAYDLGCGPGNSTELLTSRWPGAEVIGTDNSEAMLASARKRLPGVAFEFSDIATWRPGRTPDLIYANASLQWVLAHENVFPRLFDALAPGGVLAVQMPDNLTEPTHLLMEETAHAGPWKAAFEAQSVRRQPLPPPSTYYSRLIGKAARVDIWHTAYNHPMADAAAIVEWVKGTGLRPYLDHAGAEHRDAFLADYLGRVEKAYPKMSDGRVLLRFPRIFTVAVKA